MQVSCHRKNNLSYAVIDNYFDSFEEVLAEAKDLRRLAYQPEYTSSAKNEDGTHKKTGTGLFLDDLYTDRREASPILCGNRRLFDSRLTTKLEEFDACFGFISKSNRDTTLLNYYNPNQIYEAHKDEVQITVVSLLGWGDFSGGGLCFPEHDIKVEFKQNRAIVFLSCVSHASEPLTGNEDCCRVSIAHFITSN
jgi:hypothetical protein